MKKTFYIVILLFSLILFLSSCQKTINLEDNYNNDFGIINLNKDEIKIMQLTDLHFTYGFDGLDRQTFALIEALINKENPDIIIVTGDLFMTVFAKTILNKFIKFMDQFEIPWGYALGNHESEYHQRAKIAQILYNSKSPYLFYHYGPKLSNDNTHGYSNYKLRIYNDETPILNLYILDTKANRTDGIKDKDFPYDYLSVEQVEWFSNNLEDDLVNSFAFMHIPLLQYLNYEGKALEQIWAQGKDTGFFQAIKDNGNKTLGVFVGHDHLNNHEFVYEDVLLSYGVSSGFNAYGPNNSKGAKFITYNYTNNSYSTYIVLRDEVL